MGIKKLEVKQMGAVVKLEKENAELWYQNMVAESRIEKPEQEVAGLWYEIMTIGGM